MKHAAWGLAAIVAAAGLVTAAGCGDSTRSIAAGSSSTELRESPKKESANAKDTADEGKKTTPITLTPEKRPTDAAKAAQPTRNISFDSIKFPMEKQELFKLTMLTPQVKALDGRRVKIRGFMLPSFVNKGLKYFVLVRDNQECCFGPGAALFDAIHIDLAEGVTAEYSYPPIAVEGVFHIDPVENPLFGEGPLENSHIYIFRMDDARVVRR